MILVYGGLQFNNFQKVPFILSKNSNDGNTTAEMPLGFQIRSAVFNGGAGGARAPPEFRG